MDAYIHAIESNDVVKINKLLGDGMNVHYNDEDGNTLLYHAVYPSNNYDVKSRIHMIDILIKYGLKIESSEYEELLFVLVKDNRTSGVVEKLIQVGYPIDTQNYQGDTALHYACRYNNVPMVVVLLQAGIDSSVANNDGLTAVALAKSLEYNDLVEMIQEYEVPCKCALDSS